MSDDVDIVEKLECEGQMLMLDKSVGTESIKTVDKCIGNNVVRKSVRTQYNSLHTSKVLDFNSGIDNQQATTKDGTLRFKQSFSRVTQNWVIKKITEKKSANTWTN